MKEESMAIAGGRPEEHTGWERLGLVAAAIGVLLLFVAFVGVEMNAGMLALSIILMIGGAVTYAVSLYLHRPEGIKNDAVWFESLSSRGVIGWFFGIILTGFYVLLYWFPHYLGLGQEGASSGLIAFFSPLSELISGQPASQWFVYGTLYTTAILGLGFKFLLKYRHNAYHFRRTLVVMASQLFLAYFIPEILSALTSGQGYFSKDLKYFWPLNYEFFYPDRIGARTGGSSLGMLYLVVGLLMTLVITPVLTYFVGKRWYCSWVCGCGGLAETAGDSFRQLSSKKMSAWQWERWLIHTVMVLVFIMTAAVLYGYFTGSQTVFGLDIYNTFQKPYGFVIGAIFSGIIGVGFYPLLGNRVWCRFGCPLAGYMGLIQRFKSKFRITTNGGQCISCGNCSTYCEQGIDVRWYAQRGENIVRASCVGCGVCSAVCPRGVLSLENGPEEGRISSGPLSIGNEGVKINDLP